MPVHTQQLLVLLFGTFRVIASNANRADTGMTSEALGVSVAPSFFHTCVSDGKTARMEDVLRFKLATKIMKQIIENFTAYDVFGRENYEYYARVTGRVLRVQDEWIFSFRYPPPPRGKSAQQNYALQLSLQTEKTWLQCECDRWGLNQEESQSTPALLTAGGATVGNSAISLGIIPEHSLLESCARLSVSLEGPGIFSVSNQSTCSSGTSSSNTKTNSDGQQHHMTMDELRAVNRYAESTKSLSFLPQVHERQTARMRTRSEWFLGDGLGTCGEGDDEHDETACGGCCAGGKGGSLDHYHGPHPNLISVDDEIDYRHSLSQHHHLMGKRPVTQLFESTCGFGLPESERERNGQQQATGSCLDGGGVGGNSHQRFSPNMFAGHIGLSASAESVHLIRRSSSRRSGGGDRWSRNHPHRSSSRRNKENGGSRSGSFKGHHHHNHNHLQSLPRNTAAATTNLTNSNNSGSSINGSSNSNLAKAENIMRRNSKQSEDFNVEIRGRIKNNGGGGSGGEGEEEDDDDGTEQSQKKQRIVSFDRSSSDKWMSEVETGGVEGGSGVEFRLDCEVLMETTTTGAEEDIVEPTGLQENETTEVVL